MTSSSAPEDPPRLHPADVQRIAELVADRIVLRPRLVSREDLSQITGLSVSSIERREREGVLRPIRSGRSVRFDVDQAIAYLVSQGAQDGAYDDA